MIKLLGILASIFFLINTMSIGGHSQLNIESFAQNSNITNETDRKSVSAADDREVLATLNVTKTVGCDSSLGIPSDDSVCNFVLDNIDAGQFDFVVSGNQTQNATFQGSSNGTLISLKAGDYSVEEKPFDTMDLENQLGESAVVTIDTDTKGDCIGQFGQFDNFEMASGTIEQSQKQLCEIVNTISVTEGSSPEEP